MNSTHRHTGHAATRITGWVAALSLLLFPVLAAQARDLVVDPTACLKKGGDEGDPVDTYCTIQEAIDAAFLDGGGEVAIAPGVYHENLLLREDVKLTADEGLVVIEYVNDAVQPPVLVHAANHSAIAGITLRVPEGLDLPVTLIAIQQVEEVELEEVVLDGGMNRGTTGILVQSQFLETSRVVNSDITRLEVGVLAEDARFGITRCRFEDILRDAIYVRPPSIKGEDDIYEVPEVGDDDDLELSGFNRFRNIGGFTDGEGNLINEGDSFLLRNTTGRQLLAQLNDWGVYDDAGIAGGISSAEPGAKAVGKGADAALFQPFLGKSLFPGSVFARLRDTATTALITNGNPRLLLGAVDTQIEPAFDPASSLYSFTFVNPNTYTVDGRAPGYFDAQRSALVGPGQIVALEIGLNPDGTLEGEGQTGTGTHSTDQNGNNLIELGELLRVIQLYNAGTYHCAPATEDGYAVGPGDESCTQHTGDYAIPDWVLSLSETLRVVQFFNTGGYYDCPGMGTEDGYCPGPAPAG
jgi:hypothetical protein